MKGRISTIKLNIVVFAIVAIIAMCIGCKSKQAITIPSTKTVEVEKLVTKTVRDTVIEVEADSSYYRAWIECVNNKPVLKNPISIAGKNQLQAPKVKLDDLGQLMVDCQTENLELHARIEELVTELNTKETQYVNVPVERELTFFQKVFINLGKIFGVILLGFVGYGAFKLYKKIYGR
ncbi:hypothetical protein [Sphingobacterium faecium]|uniref:hypothetical protein n=1 Tax=Sphingobacterium faecium TaxID=34087 RepID=UPI002478E017|nr:hypothetical protein [Sphingobacterium faecium]WGQ12982.1 hypothetical protein QG727_13195 [Sphingobacterium faecium]